MPLDDPGPPAGPASAAGPAGAAGPGAPGTQLRVLVVTNLWPLPGTFQGIFVAEQVAALRRLGHHVDVELVARGRGRLDYLTAAPRVRRRAGRGRYDLVHVHYGLTAVAGRFAGPAPRVLSLHGSDVNSRRQRWWTRLGQGGYPTRLYASRRLARANRDPGGLVIPAGVDFELFAPAGARRREAARAALGLPAGRPVVLFGAAPGNPVKGYDVFTEVLAEARGRGVDASELVLARPGQSRRAAVELFHAADALLFTSRRGVEGSPMVVKEAAVVGLPVVSVDVGDVAEVLAGLPGCAVVGFPEPWGAPDARRELITILAERLVEVLAGDRPPAEPARQRLAWLSADRIAARVVEAYRRALSAAPEGAGRCMP